MDSSHPPDSLSEDSPMTLHIRTSTSPVGTRSMILRPRPAPVSRFAPHAGERRPVNSGLENTRNIETDAYGGSGNAGGKVRSSRRAKMTPYDRHGMVTSRTDVALPTVSPSRNTIASRLKVSAARLLTSSASYVLSSFFKSRPPALKANEEPLEDGISDKAEKLELSQQQHEVGIDSVQDGRGESNVGKEFTTARVVAQPLEKEVFGSDITQIEEILKKSTWSRDQVDRLTALLLSRVCDEDKQKEAVTVVGGETMQDKLEPETPVQLARVFMEEQAIKQSGAASPMFSPGLYSSTKVQPSPSLRLMEDRRAYSPVIRPWARSPDVVSAPKRRFDVDDDYLYSRPTRRVRQKTFDTSSLEYSRKKSGSNVISSSSPFAESSKTALRILETLEKLSPSPMAKSSDIPVKQSTFLTDNTLEVPEKRIPFDKDKALDDKRKESPTPNGKALEIPRRGAPPLNGKVFQAPVKELSRNGNFVTEETSIELPALKEQYVDKKESSTRIYPSERILQTSKAGEDRFAVNGSKSEAENVAFVQRESDFKACASDFPERSKGFRMSAIFEEHEFETATNEMPVSSAIVSDIPPVHIPSSVQPTEGALVVVEKAVIVPSSVSGEPSKHVPAVPQSVFPCEASIAMSSETSMMSASNVSPPGPTENGLPMQTESPVGGRVVEADAMVMDNLVHETVASAPVGVSSTFVSSFSGAVTQTSLNSFPAAIPTASPTSSAFPFGFQSGATTPMMASLQSRSHDTTVHQFTFSATQTNPFTSSIEPMGATSPFGSQPVTSTFSFGAQSQSAPTFGITAASVAGLTAVSSPTFAFGAQMNGQVMNSDQGSLSGGFSIGADGGPGAAKSGRKFIKVKRRR